jgi:predicted MPP superfamily phosphohydrolase
LDSQLNLIVTAGVLALGAVMLIALFIRRVRTAKHAASTQKTDPNAILMQQIDALMAHYFARMEEQQRTLAIRLQEDIRDLQCDLDWIASERMIDEAVALARTGERPEDISQKLNLPIDAAETIMRFRKH